MGESHEARTRGERDAQVSRQYVSVGAQRHETQARARLLTGYRPRQHHGWMLFGRCQHFIAGLQRETGSHKIHAVGGIAVQRDVVGRDANQLRTARLARS